MPVCVCRSSRNLRGNHEGVKWIILLYKLHLTAVGRRARARSLVVACGVCVHIGGIIRWNVLTAIFQHSFAERLSSQPYGFVVAITSSCGGAQQAQMEALGRSRENAAKQVKILIHALGNVVYKVKHWKYGGKTCMNKIKLNQSK